LGTDNDSGQLRPREPRNRTYATLQDVADRAGVSRSAASTVLNGGPGAQRASVATQERIRQAALELGYRTNAVARSLRRRVMRTIGFYNGYGYIDARNPFLSAVLAGMHAGCDRRRHDMLVHQVTGYDNVNQKVDEIVSGKVDGVVVYTERGDPAVDMLVRQGFPAVAIADAHPQITSVVADDAGGSTMLARRLAERGHRHIAYRMPPIERISANSRYSGFVKEAESLGVCVTRIESFDFLGAISPEEAAVLTAPEGKRPTAIACWSDGSALSILEFLAEQGITDQFAVTGFDGFDLPRMPAKLTTIRVDWDVVAVTAVDTVCEIVAGNSVDHLITVPVTLVDGVTD
jgi:DNA-binding LacI/PurR family transcriptional regulator